MSVITGPLSSLLLCMSLMTCPAFSQQHEDASSHAVTHSLYNKAVTIGRVEWQYPDADRHQQAITLTVILKNTTREKIIKSVWLVITAQNKKGIMLQHQGVTLRKLVRNVEIAPGESATLTFDEAFKGEAIYRVALKEATVEFENGSLEILQ